MSDDERAMATETKHTPEPWEVDWLSASERHQIIAPSRYAVAVLDHNIYMGEAEPKANADRIVACVNACKGLNPEAVPDMLAALESLLKDASYGFTCSGCGVADDAHLPGCSVVQARAAIAKAKGGAQ